MVGQALWRHFHPRRKRLELAKIDHRHFNAKGIVKAALWQTPLQRHLPAFEAGLNIATGARALPLMAAARSLAVTRAVSPSDPFALFARPRSWFQFIESHDQRISASTL